MFRFSFAPDKNTCAVAYYSIVCSVHLQPTLSRTLSKIRTHIHLQRLNSLTRNKSDKRCGCECELSHAYLCTNVIRFEIVCFCLSDHICERHLNSTHFSLFNRTKCALALVYSSGDYREIFLFHADSHALNFSYQITSLANSQIVRIQSTIRIHRREIKIEICFVRTQCSFI